MIWTTSRICTPWITGDAPPGGSESLAWPVACSPISLSVPLAVPLYSLGRSKSALRNEIFHLSQGVSCGIPIFQRSAPPDTIMTDLCQMGSLLVPARGSVGHIESITGHVFPALSLTCTVVGAMALLCAITGGLWAYRERTTGIDRDGGGMGDRGIADVSSWSA